MSAWHYGLLIVLLGWLLWRLQPLPLAKGFQFLERQRGRLRSRRHAHAGVDWHYLEGGCGEPLVLLHGFNADSHHFCRVAAHLRHHFRIIAPDLPGFGETRYQTEPNFNIDDLAKRVLAWLDDLNIHHCYAGGNSMGGYLALAMARQAPERIRGLWLLAPGGLRSAPLAPVLQEVLEDRHNPLVVRSHDDFKRLLDYCFVHRPWMPSPLLRFLAQRAMAHNHRAQRIFDAMLNDSTPAETLADGLSTPALVMWGRADQVLHVDGAEVVTQLMPNARAIVLDQVGHLPQLEQPKVVAESWVSFTQADARQATNSA